MAFNYRPKFVDIRVNKPDVETKRRDANERPCDHVGCERAGAHRAPKGRGRGQDYWFFCQEHAAEYNRRWNYFDGMTEDDFINFQHAEENGHRPTWSFRAGRGDRMSATRFWKAAAPGDAFGVFRGKGGAQAAPRPERRLSRLQTLALEALSLPEEASAVEIRTRYAELVKRWHPDSNGGDRSAEGLLQKAVHAYQTLKQGGLA